MQLTKEEIQQLVYETMEEINRKLGTAFSKERLEIAFFTPEIGVSVYEKLCEQYFPKYLREEYKKRGYFESFAAMAFLGKEKDGILIREDLDFSRQDWHHVIMHEFSHIIAARDELDGEIFFDKYCIGYAKNDVEDGWINAGYAIWREFSAEMFALDLDDYVLPYSLNDAKERIKELLPTIAIGEQCAKEAMYKSLNLIFKSDEYYLSKSEDDFIRRIKGSKVSEILIFEPVIRLIFAHLLQECAWKIGVEFISSLGCQYLMCLAERALRDGFFPKA